MLQSLFISRELKSMTCSLTCYTAKSGIAKQLKTLSCGEGRAKVEEWGKLKSEEKILCLFALLFLHFKIYPNVLT